MQDPEQVLQCIIEGAILSNGAQPQSQQKFTSNYRFPDHSEVEVAINKAEVFKRDEASKYYIFVNRIGQGGFARVFHVRRKTDNKDFALKLIEPKDADEYKNIRNEVAIMQMCNGQDSILQCVEAFDYCEKLWVFLELMDIGDLTQVLEERRGNIDEKVCAYILRKTLEALYYLHSRGIVHRDIKSDNILVNREGDIKLADFGYATQLYKQKRGTVSQVGTICWMAPELIRLQKNYNHKVDIWSFGIFAMEIADGQPPYISEKQAKVLYNIVTKDPPQINKRFSKEFKDFVKLCLTKDPEKRPSAE